LMTKVVTPRTTRTTPSEDEGKPPPCISRKHRIYDIMYGKPLDMIPTSAL
jgi:hypothetical protein